MHSPAQVCPGHVLGEPGMQQRDQPEVTPPLLPPQARGRGPRRAGQRVLKRQQTFSSAVCFCVFSVDVTPLSSEGYFTLRQSEDIYRKPQEIPVRWQ